MSDAGRGVALEPGRGNRVVDLAPGLRRRAIIELLLLWLGTNLAIRGILAAQRSMGLHEVVQAAVPFLFIYVPVLLCRHRGVDSYSYRLFIPAFRDRKAWLDAIRIVFKLVVFGLVPWIVGYHLYQTRLFHFHPAMRLPADMATVVAYHLFFVAIPEEFFYRGYIQTRFNEVFPRKFLLFGIPFGWGLFMATVMFAFGHSLVEFQWWHFATFFPGLAFALLRERTDGVITGAFLHASCNIAVHIMDTMYGLR